MNHGRDSVLALTNTLVALTLTAGVASNIAHGISVTPLIERFDRISRRGQQQLAGSLTVLTHSPLLLRSQYLGLRSLGTMQVAGSSMAAMQSRHGLDML
jgi:hypothetical protein